jgi:hypothetical protein
MISMNERAECVYTTWSMKTKLKFGDVGFILTACDPARVRVVTDRGTTVLEFD